MLDKIKLRLRISNNKYDTEILDLINEAKETLKSHGVLSTKISESDPNISAAIILYCKANFGLNNTDSEKYMNSFKDKVALITLDSNYVGV